MSMDYLKTKEIDFKTIHLKEIPKTALDVERLYGCSLNQVLKTLVFIGKIKPIIVVLPGDKKVDTNKLKNITKQTEFRMAKPNEVEEITGYKIGGVCPFAIENNIRIIIDKTAFKHQKINIGSGKAEIGIELNSEDLQKIENCIIADVID
ncbi:MAG: YbaK/EbsC family protein [Candidatus Diapherotrites archaeon]|nr:YbaK/EbsC family protein [Candidatus Diapherotrites archaeon]